MSESAIQEKFAQTQCPPSIKQDDRKSRFWLVGEEGTSLSLASDIYEKWILVNKAKILIEQITQQQQQFTEEFNRVGKLIMEWLEAHADQIVMEKSGIVGEPELSSAGKMHFRFIVTKKGHVDWIDDPLTAELILFEENLWNNFQIVRLNSLLLPNVEEE
jgi:hypothetical protein